MKHDIYEVVDLNLSSYHLKLNETLFHNANGYIGVRYDFEEGYGDYMHYVPSQYINGFYDFVEMKQAENLYGLVREKHVMVNIANTQSIRLYIDGEEFSMFTGTVLKSKLSLNMDKGMTIRDVIWRSPKGKEVHITIKRMTSFHQLSLFTIDYEVELLDSSGEVIIESLHDGNVINYAQPLDPRIADTFESYLHPINCEIKDGGSSITSVTSKSNLKVCSFVKNIFSKECNKEYSISNNQTLDRLKTFSNKGEKIRLIKYAVFSDSIRYKNCNEQCYKEMRSALSMPIEDFYKKQEEYIANYWENCLIEIDGDDELEVALKYNLYQLLQSVSKDQFGNISPKGLSGDGYDGHYFWDSEMYVQPFFTITNPSITKKLIEYRYAILERARENAKLLGHKNGALYPWRTIMGKECSGYFPAGSAQYHINGDIAYSIIAYYLATKDSDLLLKKGLEIIFETARLWIDTGNFYQGQFHINTITGPDEYTCIVNNNYYTNVLTQYHLHWAVKFYYLFKNNDVFITLLKKINLREDEIEIFQKAGDNMYLPYDETLKINPQDDSFLQKEKWDINSIPKDSFPLLLHYHPLHIYRHQICKQADTVMAHFILEDAQSEETMKNSLLYYEKITTHDSSLSKPIFCIMAARLGMEEKAYKYFGDSAKLDLLDLNRNTEDGVHIANMAGSYLMIVYGFAGFRLKESGISFWPMIPNEWNVYCFRIVYKNSRIKVSINKEECIFSLEKGKGKKIIVYGKSYILQDNLVIKKAPIQNKQKS